MQKVVRTYSPEYDNKTKKLEELLEKGYKVLFITKLNDEIIEYIVEKVD